MGDEYGVRLRVTPSEAAKIDVIFVHGLGGHASRTWEEQDSNGRLRNWTKDPEFLPAKVPYARIFSYGYNADIDAVVSTRVINHKDGLLGGLLTFRSECKDRPILWIGHSLGGIVIKQALMDRTDDYQPIIDATASIVFLGTPHHGSWAVARSHLDTAQMLVAWAFSGHNVGKTVDELKPFSDTLRDTSEAFTHIASRFKMFSFAESKPTLMSSPVDTRRRIGPLDELLGDQLIVPQGSAVMNHPNERHDTLDRTHEGLCKFSRSDDSAYYKIWQQVRFLSREAIAKHRKSNSSSPPFGPITSFENLHLYEEDAQHPPYTPYNNYSLDEVSRLLANQKRIEYNSTHSFEPRTIARTGSLPATHAPNPRLGRGTNGVESAYDMRDASRNRSQWSRGDQASEVSWTAPQAQNSVFGEDFDIEEAVEEDETTEEDDNGPLSRLSMFDTVFIVDDTRSMTLGATIGSKRPTRWKLLEKSMEAVVNDACQYDSDGVDVYFLKNTTVLREVKDGHKILDSLAEIKLTFKQPITCGPTYMQETLERVISPRISAYRNFHHAQNACDASVQKPKPLNLIFITDGAAVDEEEVEQYIRRVAGELDRLEAPSSFIGIQFVQIGDDQSATEFLERLDNQLEGLYQVRDIVDTTPWVEGQPLTDKELLDKFVKVLLGAVTRNIDKWENPRMDSKEESSRRGT